MKNKICFALCCVWSIITAFFAPICFGLIYMNITGHSKGYGYDLGAEKDISISLGIFELIIWLALAIPSNIYIFRQMRGRKIFYVTAIVLYALLFIGGIMLIGGLDDFGRFFHA